MLLQRASHCFKALQAPVYRLSVRSLKTLSNNPHIYAIPESDSSGSHILTYLKTVPPTESLAIGTTTTLPPTPKSFTPNPKFLPILNSVLSENVFDDPDVQNQAHGFAASTSTQILSTQRRRGGKRNVNAAVGGWLHVSDNRKPPDWARIADPEDIFGSVMVDGTGQLVRDAGTWSESGTYRLVTNDGILGLSDFLRGKLVQRLEEEERKIKAESSQ
ncbi:hypothetical protein BJ508DRAFT_410357 [Ascobolus immersus RN42]|uniref:Uncharacterized protein n=1 Tax=Ascobolus immersus RN42 TaxID=1160509 RepID=A0A3N4J0Z9_ASCIM|nr:hypothetical protein BJ508DRAFT_410357 [Ascobolus immersus RN42]